MHMRKFDQFENYTPLPYFSFPKNLLRKIDQKHDLLFFLLH